MRESTEYTLAGAGLAVGGAGTLVAIGLELAGFIPRPGLGFLVFYSIVAGILLVAGALWLDQGQRAYRREEARRRITSRGNA